MAYKYRQNDVDGSSAGYVKYNITPDYNYNMGSDDTVTITAQIYNGLSTVRSVSVMYSINSRYFSSTELCYVNKTISKGKTATVTFEFKIPDLSRWTQYGDMFTMYLYFQGSNQIGGYSGLGDIILQTGGDDSQFYNIIRVRRTPVLSSLSLIDRHTTIDSEHTKTPLQYFGHYIQGESLPCLTVDYLTDNRDVKLTTTHHLVVTDDDSIIVCDITENAEALATFASINLPVISDSGTYNYTWTIIDSAGLSTATTGTFTVLAYSPPEITTFLLDRYKYIIDEGNVIADDGENLLLTFNGSVSSVIGPDDNKNAWSLDLKYNELDSETINYQNITSDADGRDIEYNLNDEAFTTSVSANSTFNFVATLSDMLNTVQASYVVLKAGGYLNVEKTGVAVGMRSTSAALNKKFEVAEDYTSHMYGGIAGVNNYPTVASGTLASAEELTGGHWVDGKPLYRRIYHITSVNSSNAADVDISDLDYDFIKWEGYFNITYNTDTTEQWLDTYNWGGNNDRARVYIFGTTLRLRLGGYLHLSSKGAWIILEYTKNTTT